ncbi:MAG: HAD hydrolase-like protein [Deltaproteobacteria bacterium]|nr:HAD hydrolase-like protein [Deltaproteobacteria bacterium]
MSDGHPQKKVCVFDFDGTLVDSMGAFADLAGELIAETYGVKPVRAREDYLRTSGLPFFQQLESLFPKDGRNAQVADAFEVRKKEDYFGRPFFDEVPGAIADLQERGVRAVISSNNGQELVEEYLDRRPEARFDLVLGFKQGFSKGKAHFEKVLHHFDLETSDLLFVGDSLHDARQALDFGVDFVGRLGTFEERHFLEVHPRARTVHGLDQLMGVLCK